MTHLLDVFVDADTAERARYWIEGTWINGKLNGYVVGCDDDVVYSTNKHDRIEPWIARRGVEAMIAKLADRAGYDDIDVKDWLLMVLSGEIHDLAAEPETTMAEPKIVTEGGYETEIYAAGPRPKVFLGLRIRYCDGSIHHNFYDRANAERLRDALTDTLKERE